MDYICWPESVNQRQNSEAANEWHANGEPFHSIWADGRARNAFRTRIEAAGCIPIGIIGIVRAKFAVAQGCILDYYRGERMWKLHYCNMQIKMNVAELITWSHALLARAYFRSDNCFECERANVVSAPLYRRQLRNNVVNDRWDREQRPNYYLASGRTIEFNHLVAENLHI